MFPICRPIRRSGLCYFAVLMGTLAAAPAVRAQPFPVPGTFLPTIGLGSGATNTLSASRTDAILVDVLGSAGSASGYSQYVYGSGVAQAGNLRINGTFSSPLTVAYTTNTIAAPTASPNTAPNNGGSGNFLTLSDVTTNTYTFKMFAATSGNTNGFIQLRLNNSGTATYYTPTTTSNAGGADDGRLNEILQFNEGNFKYRDGLGNDQFITSLPGFIDAGSPNSFFRFSLSDAITTGPNAGNYSSITLTYNPVPEPSLLLGLATVGLAGLRLARRRA